MSEEERRDLKELLLHIIQQCASFKRDRDGYNEGNEWEKQMDYLLRHMLN